jgi:hypothetical protein
MQITWTHTSKKNSETESNNILFELQKDPVSHK